MAQSVGDCHEGWKMTPLQEWLLLYLQPRGATDTPWRDGHLYTEALNRIFPEWFSKIR